MKKKFRIKKNGDFQKVFKHGKSFANRQLVIYHIEKSEQDYFRIGLSVGKKIGNAVVRNRIKRHLRQAFQELQPTIRSGYDFVIIARMPTKDLDYQTIRKSVVHLLTREKLFKK